MIAFAKPEQELNEVFDDGWEPTGRELKAIFDSFRKSEAYLEFIAKCDDEDELKITRR
jgi:hypothetical protein